MKILKSLAVVALVAAPVATAAAATEPGLPTTPYVGDMKITGGPNKQTISFKIYYSADKQRMDMNMGGQSMSVISDKTAKTTTMLMVSSKAYVVRPYQQSQSFTEMLRLKGANYEVVGDEKCGEYTCTKYKASGTSPKGDKFSGFMWFTKDHNILMRIEGASESNGKSETFTMAMENLKVGPIDPKAFTVPEGYNKIPGAK